MNEKFITVQLFGDISFNGRYNDPTYQNAVIESLKLLDKQIGRPDIRIANWEAPITRTNDFHPDKNPILAVTEKAAQLINYFPIDALCLSNNHIGDCGEEGVQSTIDFLDDLGIDHFGATLQRSPELVIKDIKGLKIGLLAFLGKETNPKISEGSNIKVNYIEDRMLKAVINAKEVVDILIVNLHWGIEFLKYPSSSQILIAREIVDCGADIILGHHPHRLQGSEIYNGRSILYSMGNFIFDGLKGKEHIGWPKMSNHSGLYELRIAHDGSTIRKSFVPLSIKGLEISLDKNKSLSLKRQSKLDKYIESGSKGDGLKRKLHVFWVWAVKMPLFFVYSRGGLIGALKSARFAHIRMLQTYFFRQKSDEQ